MAGTYASKPIECSIYINDNRENVKEMSVFKPLTKELLNSFCCTHACHNFIFGTMAFFQHKEGLI
jgi:hypothetical protein